MTAPAPHQAPLPAALLVFAACLPLGEGPAAVGFVGLAWSTWRAGGWAARGRAAAGPRPAVCLATGLTAYFALCTLAALASPWGLRLGALGHLVPPLAAPLVACAVHRAGAPAGRRACTAFVVSTVVAACVGLVCAAWQIYPGALWGRSPVAANGQHWVPGTQRLVAAGFYFHRLKMAHLLPLALAPLCARQLLRTAHRRQLGRELVAGALLGWALVATYARAALLACAVAALVCGLLARPRRRALVAWLGAAAAALGVAGLCAPHAAARLLAARQPAAGEVRAVIWSQALALARDFPLGVGLGNYGRAVGPYYDLAAPLTASPRTGPHSQWLGTLTEAGPLGLGLALQRTGGFLQQALAAAVARQPSRRREAGLASLFAALALGGVGLLHDVTFHQTVAWPLWAAVGLATSLLAHEPAANQEGL